jgi:signal transduction histidine kinase
MTQKQVCSNASIVPEWRDLLLRMRDELARTECVNRPARVRVRDWRLGIPRRSKGTCSNLFSRGRAGGDTRSNSGLGPFIARRVLEARGGSTSLRPFKRESTFVLELPAEGWQLCAS